MKRDFRLPLQGLPAACALCLVLASPADGQSVTTYHNSNQRSGAYVIPALTKSAAAAIQPDIGFHATISGHVYAQPLFWKPAGADTGLVIVVTESNNVYALDENTGAIVWQRSLGNPMPLSQLPCGNIDPMGITGTPVIDPAKGLVYLDAMTKTQSGARHMVHALSLSDGSSLKGWPIDVQQALAAKGVSFDSSVQGERSALLYYGHELYVVYGGHYGDCGAYRGTVIQITPKTKAIAASWQTRATGGGIWAQGGLAGDGKDLFITTGNTFGASQWSDGEAIIRLKPGLAHSSDAKDYFAPSNWKDLDNSDEDLGGTEAIPIDVLVPGKSKRVIAFGKDGNAYLANRKNLGGTGGQIQTLAVSSHGIRTAPAVLEMPSQTLVAFTSGGGACGGGNITMLSVAPMGHKPMSVAWCAPLNGGGAPIVTTTDGSANALVWVAGAEGDNELHAFDAKTGQAVFSGAGTSMTGLHHFETILATQSRLYVGADNSVYAFKF